MCKIHTWISRNQLNNMHKRSETYANVVKKLIKQAICEKKYEAHMVNLVSSLSGVIDCYWLLLMVIGHWSLVIGHWSLVIGHWSL